jgi:hypothetical protein
MEDSGLSVAESPETVFPDLSIADDNFLQCIIATPTKTR